MLRHPYFASAVARLRVWIIEEPWCQTMATDGFNVFVGLNFLETTPEEEIIGVLAHEVVHVIFGHIERRGNRERAIWNAAIDYATNGFLVELGFRLPGYGLLEPKYRGMTAEDIYDALGKSGRTDSKAPVQDSRPPLDWHVDHGSLEGIWARDHEYPTPAEIRRLREAWCGDLKSKLPGNIRGDMSEEIRKAGQPAVDWKALLHHFTSGLRNDDYRLYPFNKRHLWRHLYMP
jgi:predicted metal-dependent peptidase